MTEEKKSEIENKLKHLVSLGPSQPSVTIGEWAIVLQDLLKIIVEELK